MQTALNSLHGLRVECVERERTTSKAALNYQNLFKETNMNQSQEDENTILLLSGKDVDEILNEISIDDLIKNQTKVFSTYSSTESKWESPIRTTINSSTFTHLFMPSRNEDQVTIKCVAVPNSGSGGLPATGLQFDSLRGQTRVIINVAQLTGVRTAAGCLSASIAMQKSKSSKDTQSGNIVIFGTGMQAKWHARLFVQYYRLGKVTFITTNSNQRSKEDVKQSLQQQLPKETQVDVLLQDSQAIFTALNEAHFICGCAPSTEPRFLWDKVRLRDDVHFSLIGSYKPHMQEVPKEVIERAASENALSVDSIQACSHEAGDLLKSSTSPKDWQEIGKIISNKDSKDLSNNFSIFKSVGLALQDTAIFDLVVKQAEAKNIGKKVDFY